MGGFYVVDALKPLTAPGLHLRGHHAPGVGARRREGRTALRTIVVVGRLPAEACGPAVSVGDAGGGNLLGGRSGDDRGSGDDLHHRRREGGAHKRAMPMGNQFRSRGCKDPIRYPYVFFFLKKDLRSKSGLCIFFQKINPPKPPRPLQIPVIHMFKRLWENANCSASF